MGSASSWTSQRLTFIPFMYHLNAFMLHLHLNQSYFMSHFMRYTHRKSVLSEKLSCGGSVHPEQGQGRRRGFRHNTCQAVLLPCQVASIYQECLGLALRHQLASL